MFLHLHVPCFLIHKKDLFATLHQRFSWMLKACGNRITEKLLEGPPRVCTFTLAVYNYCISNEQWLNSMQLSSKHQWVCFTQPTSSCSLFIISIVTVTCTRIYCPRRNYWQILKLILRMMIFKVSPHSLEGLLLQFTCTQKLIAALAAATVVANNCFS